MQIEHDPNEPKIDRSNTVFYASWAIVIGAWACLFFGGYAVDWWSVAMGIASAAVLIITVHEKTDNVPPKPWRR